MNKDEMTGAWRQLRGRIRKEWGKLTDDELKQAEGNYDMLVGRIQEKYGATREEIKRRLDALAKEGSASDR